MFQNVDSLNLTGLAKTSVTNINNLSTSKQRIYGTSVNTAINLGKNNFYSSEVYFIQDWNIVVILNLICGSINMNTNCIRCGGNDVENPSKKKGICKKFSY